MINVENLKNVNRYEHICPFKTQEDRKALCDWDYPHFMECNILDKEWKKQVLMKQLESYKHNNMDEEIAKKEITQIKKMLTPL